MSYRQRDNLIPRQYGHNNNCNCNCTHLIEATKRNSDLFRNHIAGIICPSRKHNLSKTPSSMVHWQPMGLHSARTVDVIFLITCLLRLFNSAAGQQRIYQQQQQALLRQQPAPLYPGLHRSARYAPQTVPRIMQQPPQLAQPSFMARGLLEVSEEEEEDRAAEDPTFFRQQQLIMPYDGFELNGTDQLARSYVIEDKRFVEAVGSRCWASTILEDPKSVEPSFIIIRPKSELRLNATAPTGLILKAGFNPTMMTRILIHGFTQSYPGTAWLRRIRALFELNSQLDKQNLVIMDWGSASQGSYAQVAGRVSGMASFLANFLMKLVELGADRKKIHIIGHSLGAHLAGFAGKRMRPRIGHITALDPAGPCFGRFFSNSAQDRLTANDAHQVDVYHYDDSFLGLPGQHGHLDIYVNGGSAQPGCANNYNAMLQALLTVIFRRDRVLSESHTRSTEVASCRFGDTECQQVAYECRDYNSFSNGECGRCDDFNGQCFLMGFDFQYSAELTPTRGQGSPAWPAPRMAAAGPGKRLFIRTGPTELYCQQHYQILVKFEPSPEMALAARRNKWRLQLDLLTDLRNQERLNVSLSNQMASNVFSYLLLIQRAPFRFVGAHLQALSSDGNQVRIGPRWSGSQQAQATFWPFAIEINFMSNIDPDIRRVMSSRLCPMAQQQQQQLQQQPPQAQSQNQIAGSDPPTNWLQFTECLPPAQPVG